MISVFWRPRSQSPLEGYTRRGQERSRIHPPIDHSIRGYGFEHRIAEMVGPAKNGSHSVGGLARASLVIFGRFCGTETGRPFLSAEMRFNATLSSDERAGSVRIAVALGWRTGEQNRDG